jgi:hypothetical protein
MWTAERKLLTKRIKVRNYFCGEDRAYKLMDKLV